ncbi:MAG: tRNA (guanosine(37)-N1)-methyltransferase TrmD [Chloroflexota bacterium]
MRIHIVTLFPEMFEGPFSASIVGRAVRDGRLEIEAHQLRDYTHDRHRTVDDTPYGGGPGMVMMAPPIFEAVEDLKGRESARGDSPRVVLLSAQGRLLTQRVVRELAEEDSLILVCGHYEGVDERVVEHLVDDEISIGDYILTGGEPAAIVVVDSVARLLPGVLGCSESPEDDSFSEGLGGLLEGPVYTRPYEFRGWKTPDILLSGDHARVGEWHKEQSRKRTRERRPDLLEPEDERETGKEGGAKD